LLLCGNYRDFTRKLFAAYLLRLKRVGIHGCIHCDGPLGKGTARMKLGFRQGVASAAVFGAVLFMLVSVDDRVRDRFTDLFGGGNGLSPWADRAGDLSNALMSAIRYQSIENAPLLIFAAVGAVLVAFMLRT
jgi:hypothetical protein